MALGLTGSPSTFQNLLDRLLAGLKSDIASSYIDDILSAAQTFEKMMSNLRTIFERIQQAKLRFNPSKCFLFQKRIRYLGVYLSEDGIETDSEKVLAVQNMEIPRTRKQVQRFIGAASWFRQHIENFSELSRCLTATLKGDKFKMTAEA